jgi:transporter family protein
MSLPVTSHAKILAIPAWLFYSLLTILAWGAWGSVSKVASGGVDAYTNQVFFSIGLLPLTGLVWLSSAGGKRGPQTRKGATWAFLTGTLGGLGNIAFFHALIIGGMASIVVPVTALFPLVTVILAVILLRERVNLKQRLGLVLALISIFLLSR